MKLLLRKCSVLLLLFFYSCTGNQPTGPKYFDFDALLDDQASQLSQRKRVLSKVIEVSENQSDTTYLPSQKGWESELEIFRELEAMNKPAYQKTYKISDSVQDVNSNLTIRQFSTIESPVSRVSFFYHKDLSNIKKIEASVIEKNVLYTNTRVLIMEFEEEEVGKPILIRYAVSGFQKMILSDTVRFSIQANVNW